MTLAYPIPKSLRQTDIFLGDGGTVYGPFDFNIFDADDVEVWTLAVGDVRFSKVETVTIAKVANLPFDDFTVTFAAPQPLTTEIVVVSRRLDERSAGVLSGTRIDPDALEKEFSKISTEMQELRRDIGTATRSDFGQGGFVIDPGLQDGEVLMKQGDRFVRGPDAEDLVLAEGYAEAAREDAEAAHIDRLAADAAKVAASASASMAQQRFVRARVVATSNVSIANGLENGDTIDGVVLVSGDVVLLAGQSAPSQNGIYVVPAAGAASRSPQFAAFNDYPGTMVTVLEGTTGAGSRWQCFNPLGGTLGVTAIVFMLTSLTGQDGEGFFRGGTVSRNATTPNTQIDVAPVSCRDKDNTVTISRAATITKRLDAVFAVGSGGGGLDTGVKAADTFYFVFEIFNPSTLASDVLLSASLNSPVMPSGFTKRRLNHAIRTDSSGNIIAFVNIGEWLYWNTDFASVASAVNGTTPTLRQLSVPSGAKLEVDVDVQAFSNAAANPGWVSVRDPDRGTFTASIATAVGFYNGVTVGPSNSLWWTSQMRLWTDNVGRVYSGDTNVTDGRINIKTLGFRFDRTNTR